MSKDLEIEERIYEEIIVDCYDEEEQNTAWICYIQDTLEYPFEATITLDRKDGKKDRKRVNVVRFAESKHSRGSFSLSVEVEFEEYLIPIPILDLEDVEASEESLQAINDWKYWNK